MKKKPILVTALMTTMLVIIDAFLYQLSMSGFVALTGMITVYGYYRCAVDFCAWLSKPEKSDEAHSRFLWQGSQNDSGNVAATRGKRA